MTFFSRLNLRCLVLLTALVVLQTASQVSGGSISYTYDAAGRLIGVDYGTGTNTTYTYDNNGNLLAKATDASINADLSLAKTGSVSTIDAGSNLVYTLVVSNSGPDTASAVTITDPLPFGALYGTVVFSQGGSCTITGTTINCNLGILANGATATVTITVMPVLAGVFTNTATVASRENDPDTGDNSASAQTTVNAPPDSDSDGMPNWWELLHFGSTTAGNPNSDSDGDGVKNLDEYRADTNPKTNTSFFVITAISNLAARAIYFKSSAARKYSLVYSSNLLSGVWTGLQTNVPGTGAEMSISDTNSVNQRMYRLQTGAP